ncbi:hypothetical protein [Saccharopolyspora sp. NPDC002686]|uniref:hypothetical protein n=1 Tax=Saccharopolyspora sp. NPDC002686 TaxID=3154541 RepID=UPI00331DF50D
MNLLIYFLVAQAVVAVLWSNPERGRKLLVKWGVPEPSDTQITMALHYRRLRWICYPFLLTGMAGVSVLMTGGDRDGMTSFPAALLFAAAIAELLALPTSKHAPPVRHPLFSLIPRWGAVLYGVALLTTIVVGIIDLPAEDLATSALASTNTSNPGIAQRPIPTVAPLVATAAVLLAVAVVLRVSTTRSFSADRAVDLALRVRSARVALALGVVSQVVYVLSLAWWRIPVVANQVHLDDSALGWAQVDRTLGPPLAVLVFLTLACWPLLASPPTPKGLLRKRPC